MEVITAGLSLVRELLQTMPRLGGFVIICIAMIVLMAALVKFGLVKPDDSDDEYEANSQKIREEILETSKKEYDLNGRILSELIKSNKCQEQIVEELQLLREQLMFLSKI
jgi:hypothetical protein